jgi:hypothetical protein
VLVAALLVMLFGEGLAAQAGRIEGTVGRDGTREPIAGARVCLVGAGLCALTGQHGFFFITGVGAGTYTLRVEAIGFASVVSSDHRMSGSETIRVFFWMRQTGEAGAFQDDGRREPLPITAGLGVGGWAGLDWTTAPAGATFASGGEYGVFLRYGVPFGLFLHVGANFSGPDLVEANPSYHVTGFFIEPRLFMRTGSPRWAPFVAGRFGLILESASALSGSRLTSSGHSVGGGAGVAVRLGSQLALEGGAKLERVAYGPYTFQGDFAWYECLNALESGTSLPVSLVECGDAVSFGSAIRLCYPPFNPFSAGNCDPPTVPYPGTSRIGRRFGMWLGMNVSFTWP